MAEIDPPTPGGEFRIDLGEKEKYNGEALEINAVFDLNGNDLAFDQLAATEPTSSYLTDKQVASLLGVTVSCCRKWRPKRRGPST